MGTRIRPNFEAEFAGLTQQVAGIENDYRDLKVVVISLDKKLEANNLNLDRKIDAAFTALANKIDARAATPWGSIWAALSVLIGGMSLIGWLAMQPLKEALSEQHSMIVSEQKTRADQDSRTREMISAMRSKTDFMRGFTAATNPNFHD